MSGSACNLNPEHIFKTVYYEFIKKIETHTKIRNCFTNWQMWNDIFHEMLKLYVLPTHLKLSTK